MQRNPVSPEVADEVEGYLKKLAPEGGTWKDIFRMSRLAESVIRDALFTLKGQGRVTETRQYKGLPRGGKPSLWRVKSEEEP